MGYIPIDILDLAISISSIILDISFSIPILVDITIGSIGRIILLSAQLTIGASIDFESKAYWLNLVSYLLFHIFVITFEFKSIFQKLSNTFYYVLAYKVMDILFTFFTMLSSLSDDLIGYEMLIIVLSSILLSFDLIGLILVIANYFSWCNCTENRLEKNQIAVGGQLWLGFGGAFGCIISFILQFALGIFQQSSQSNQRNRNDRDRILEKHNGRGEGNSKEDENGTSKNLFMLVIYTISSVAIFIIYVFIIIKFCKKAGRGSTTKNFHSFLIGIQFGLFLIFDCYIIVIFMIFQSIYIACFKAEISAKDGDIKTAAGQELEKIK
ncbi:unnamed protein product [Paramecium sonneborni]|uniref:Transmembrane protein n=1 Tax=Paramecium sonneborni TaxID=65129 RepID=A0A8S1KPJ5_9CILI|nr:unnamed protein product [Paramecium sonneborni]